MGTQCSSEEAPDEDTRPCGLGCANLASSASVVPLDSFDTDFEVDEDKALGEGTFSQVYLCWRPNKPHKKFAVKVIRSDSCDEFILQRIRVEVGILNVIKGHPNIVQLVGFYNDPEEERMRVVLELCEGGDLQSRLNSKQFYQEQEGKLLVRNVLGAIAYIHTKGIMHRDLKGENILMTSKHSDTDIKISDFGLAKISPSYPRQLPRSTTRCGTDYYLAPELIKQEEYGREVDVWAFGVMTYLFLCGTLPFADTDLYALYQRIMQSDLRFGESHWRSLSDGARDFIAELLQVRANDRPTAEQAREHYWLLDAVSPAPSFSETSELRHSNGFC